VYLVAVVYVVSSAGQPYNIRTSVCKGYSAGRPGARERSQYRRLATTDCHLLKSMINMGIAWRIAIQGKKLKKKKMAVIGHRSDYECLIAGAGVAFTAERTLSPAM
jgi:hypothetical protein